MRARYRQRLQQREQAAPRTYAPIVPDFSAADLPPELQLLFSAMPAEVE